MINQTCLIFLSLTPRRSLDCLPDARALAAPGGPTTDVEPLADTIGTAMAIAPANESRASTIVRGRDEAWGFNPERLLRPMRPCGERFIDSISFGIRGTGWPLVSDRDEPWSCLSSDSGVNELRTPRGLGVAGRPGARGPV